MGREEFEMFVRDRSKREADQAALWRTLPIGLPAVAPPACPLTPRELDVLRLVAEGNGNGEVAERLCIGLGTVKGHIRDILYKLEASDRTHAAVHALRHGYIE
jgi:DNA-binding NarL/FixJ family response regulator